MRQWDGLMGVGERVVRKEAQMGEKTDGLNWVEGWLSFSKSASFLSVHGLESGKIKKLKK